MIRMQGLNKFFYRGRQNEIHVLHDISMDLPEQGMVAVFGRSGCGKTTLLNVIGGLDRCDEGTVTVDGQDICQNTDTVRNRLIGYIFQNYHLNRTETCFENVADALRLCGMTDAETIRTRVLAALANVGMEQYEKRMPDTLSGGQQQRIAIARAIVKNPRIVLADEPTGNLDEANTVMIMDLLKAISRDHLVLLVTHEAHLVDDYCDTVIELSDGKIVGVRQNQAANGLSVRDPRDIYLGELACHTLHGDNIEVSCYGEPPAVPIRLTLVNSGGRYYLQVGSERVQVLDASCEVRLREGVYEAHEPNGASERDIDMASLPPVEGTHFGRLFSLRSSVKSGYRTHLKGSGKGKRLLRTCMCLFAAATVLMTAIFGTAFGELFAVNDAYHHSVFYLYTPDVETSQRLNAAVGEASTGIDFVRLCGENDCGDAWAFFRTGSFETFDQSNYDSNFKTNAVYLDLSLAQNLKLAEGKKDGLADEEILITTKVADALLKRSTLGYITERKDLLGLLSTMFTVDGKNPRIAGIVESDESAVYLTELAMAKYVQARNSDLCAVPASRYGLTVRSGEAVLATWRTDLSSLPHVGDRILLRGRNVQITEIKQGFTDYGKWLLANGKKKPSEEAFFRELVRREAPTVNTNTEAFRTAVQQARTERLYEYYDTYYADFGAYLADCWFFGSDDLDLWLYVQKGIEKAKYAFLPEEYVKAIAWKEQYGSYPTQETLRRESQRLPDADALLQSTRQLYENAFYADDRPSFSSSLMYLVSDADYIAFSKQLGETHESAFPASTREFFQIGGTADTTDQVGLPDIDIDNTETAIVVSGGGTTAVVDRVDKIETRNFTLIHSTDPQKTEAWIEENFAAVLRQSTADRDTFVTPRDRFDSLIADTWEEVLTGLIALAVLLVLMSLCMYFIMRSSLLSCIKEVGIARAIGVSKKNLVFRFLIEAAVLTTLTVLIGYLAASGFVSVCLGISSAVAEFLYYPLWLALAVLAVLYGICLLFGILPILSLLRKTPSEILAKYDI